MGIIGKTIVPAGSLALHYGEQMLKDVKKDTFARLALGKDGHAVQSNHPAWVYGHLACYTQRCMELVGKPAGAAARPAGFEDLFKNGTPCLDDPQGKIYPVMETITAAYFHGYKAVLAVLPEVSDDVYLSANPAEGRFKELFPTIGGAITFMIAAHPMSHLGQVSAWRRFMGLSSAM